MSNNHMKKAFSAAFAAFAMGMLPMLRADEAVLQAFIDTRDTSPTLTLGRTRSDLSQCIQWAEEYGVPLVGIWSNEGCSHCERLERAMTSEAFLARARQSGFIICAIFNSDGKGTITKSDPEGVRGGDGYQWCWGYGNSKIYKKISQFPFVRFYWKKDGKLIVDACRTGDQVDGNTGTDAKTGTITDEYGTYSTVAGKTAQKAGIAAFNYMKAMFPGYEPIAITDYAGGEFANVTDAENDRLEVEATTTSVSLNLIRSASAAESQATNILTVTYPVTSSPAHLLGATSDAAATGDTTLLWAVGETEKTVNLPVNASGLSKGDKITLILKDEGGEGRSTNHIWYVEKDVSASNPLWIGERTPDTLAAGEWTMDLDAALERTSAQDGEAYTLIEFTGELWCPWCRGAEHYFLSTDAFKSFVADKNIALVSLDNPRRLTNADDFSPDKNGGYKMTNSVSAGPYGAAPTLLRAEVGTSGNTTASGRGYMTRKMIAEEDAEVILQRNHDLGYVGGAYATPDAYRTGYPTFVLLDKSGAIIGRLNYQYSETKDDDARYPFDLAENMIRLTNLVATASAAREANRYATTTELSTAVGVPVEVDLGINCPAQAVRLENIPSGTVEFSADSTAGDIVLTLCRIDEVVLQRKKEDLSVLKEETLSMPVTVAAGTNTLSHAFSSADAAGNYVLKVSAYEGADKRKIGAEGLSLTTTVSSATVLVPEETESVFMPVVGGIVLEIEEGTIYKLSGGWLDLETAFSETNEMWVATKSGRVPLNVTPGEEIRYQIWRPGYVGFTSAKRTVKEAEIAVPVELSRKGGVSGDVTITVSLDEDNTANEDFDGAPRYEPFDPVTITWRDGENFATNVVINLKDDEHFDGEGTVALKISKEAGAAEVTNSTFVLTVTDPDPRSPGSVVFVETGPLYFKESAGATVHAVRKTASDGAVSVTVSTTAGTLSTSEIAWGNRVSDEQEVTLTGLEAGTSATLTLKAASGGVTVPSAGRSVKVISVADDSPEFEETAVSFDGLTRYVMMSNQVAVKAGTFTEGNDLEFAKKSGALPPGLTAKWDKASNGLLFVGAPTKAGSYKTVYQVSEKRGSKKVSGLTTEISFVVVDPTSETGDAPVVNTAVAVTRTFKDVMMIVDGKLRGVLQVTIPPTGRASAKLVCAEGTLPFVSQGWTQYDDVTGAMTTTLDGSKTKALHWALMLTANADGSVDLTLEDPEGPDIEATISGETWSADNTASAYEGYYTVTLPVKSMEEGAAAFAPTGSGYLTVKMQGATALKSGKATWAGMLPNGTTISGSAILTDGGSSASFPVFTSSSKDVVAGVVRILEGAKALKEGGNYHTVSAPTACPKMVWQHKEPDGSNESYTAALGVYGGLYDKDDDLASHCQELYDSTDMFLVAEGVDGASGVTVSPNSVKLDSASNGLSAKLSFNSSTGIASGTMKDGSKTLTWRGVVLLGWIDCGCSATISEDVFPFVTGAFFYDEKISYETPAGKTKPLSVKRGGKAKIDCSTSF